MITTVERCRSVRLRCSAASFERRDARKTPSRTFRNYTCLQMEHTIPLYTPDGELCDWITEPHMLRLEQLDLITVVRHKKGRVARCTFRRCPGDPLPVPLAGYLGTRYSFREHLPSGYYVWAHKRLRQGDVPAQDTEGAPAAGAAGTGA
jgi:hypothetical protein